jgi:hypothetical protein
MKKDTNLIRNHKVSRKHCLNIYLDLLWFYPYMPEANLVLHNGRGILHFFDQGTPLKKIHVGVRLLISLGKKLSPIERPPWGKEVLGINSQIYTFLEGKRQGVDPCLVYELQCEQLKAMARWSMTF